MVKVIKKAKKQKKVEIVKLDKTFTSGSHFVGTEAVEATQKAPIFRYIDGNGNYVFSGDALLDE